MVIRDTTSDGIVDWVEPEFRVPMTQSQRADVENMDDIQDENEREAGDGENEEDEDMDEDSDIEIQSVGIELNERLIAAAAQREAGIDATVMDEEWEQWLKDQVEAGGLPFISSDLSPNANIPGTRPAITTQPTQASNPRALSDASLGLLQQVPDFLHNLVRQNVEANNRRVENAPSSTYTSWLNATTSLRAARATLSETASRRLDPGLVNRIDDHFLEQFSRRPAPPLQGSSAVGSGLSIPRLSQSHQGGS